MPHGSGSTIGPRGSCSAAAEHLHPCTIMPHWSGSTSCTPGKLKCCCSTIATLYHHATWLRQCDLYRREVAVLLQYNRITVSSRHMCQALQPVSGEVAVMLHYICIPPPLRHTVRQHNMHPWGEEMLLQYNCIPEPLCHMVRRIKCTPGGRSVAAVQLHPCTIMPHGSGNLGGGSVLAVQTASLYHHTIHMGHMGQAMGHLPISSPVEFVILCFAIAR